MGSFQILHLLAELFDHALELEADIGQLDIVRFGTQRVGLTVEFLREKIESAANGAAICDQSLDLGDVRRQPIEFLAGVIQVA